MAPTVDIVNICSKTLPIIPKEARQIGSDSRALLLNSTAKQYKFTTATNIENLGTCSGIVAFNADTGEKLVLHSAPELESISNVARQFGKMLCDLAKNVKSLSALKAIILGGDANTPKSFELAEEFYKILEDGGFNTTVIFGSKEFNPKKAESRLNIMSKSSGSSIYGEPFNNIEIEENLADALEKKFDWVELSDAFDYKIVTPECTYDTII